MKNPGRNNNIFFQDTDIQSVDAINIEITGLVQGVGFRPHVYRVARGHHISGWVNNTTNGVSIRAIGNIKDLSCFIRDVCQLAPTVAEIKNLEVYSAINHGEIGFDIRSSTESGDQEITEISPDIAVCADCIEDIKSQENRIGYPLVNCTNCGPRFSIIHDIPYDRQQTSMAGFRMCEHCAAEYHDLSNRRFHAQPNACCQCGPQYTLYGADGEIIHPEELPRYAAQLIDRGCILAIKATGGFHLVCDAQNASIVKKLRTSKYREGKPFAVMFASMSVMEKYARIYTPEARAIASWQRPVVLVEGKNKLPREVNSGLKSIGALLPYMPFHHLLFEHLHTDAIICTSGNISEEPVLIDRQMVFSRLQGIFDYVIDYNRDIVNRTDDSVIQLIDGQQQLIRRSRGFVPKPVHLAFHADGILATGAELKNCFCMGKAQTAIMSQHIGDLKNMETFSYFCEAYKKAKRLFRFQPTLIATDMHPDYLTTNWSQQQGLPIEYVQHHHAHIASCMAEHQISESVIGLSFDGTGYGTDGHIWGGEVMLCDLVEFERLFHFEYMPMPGGEKAIKEPWRMALGCLYKVYGNTIPTIAWQAFAGIDRKRTDTVLTALRRHIHIRQTSGIGRLFDTVAFLLGHIRHAGFEAEGPMRLEARLDPCIRDAYPSAIHDGSTISVAPIIEGILEDIRKKTPAEAISARFHNTIIEAAYNAVCIARQIKPSGKVILSGGAFQNRYLLQNLTKKLQKAHMQVFTNQQVPVNDGGIALGQLTVAAARRNRLQKE